MSGNAEHNGVIQRIRPSWLGRNLVFLFILRGLRSPSQAYLNVPVPIYLARLAYSAVELGFIFTALLYYLFFRHISPPEEREAIAGDGSETKGAETASPNGQAA